MDPNTATPTPDAQAITPGSPQWDALMVQAGNNAVPSQPAQDPQQERPEWLPEKFNSPADLAKAYAELERKLSAPKSQTPSTPPSQNAQAGAETPQSPQGNAQEQQAREAVADAGINYDALSTEFAENGTLSDDSYKLLESKGIPRDMVDAYIEGQNAIADALTSKVFQIAGGEEPYRQMLDWAKTNLSPQEQAAYDRAIYADAASASLAVQGLVAKYQQENGRFGSLINGKAGTGNTAGYNSRAEMIRDMGDIRYKSDSAFRANVENRLALTTAF